LLAGVNSDFCRGYFEVRSERKIGRIDLTSSCKVKVCGQLKLEEI
jgi:hypothetical protein